MMKKLFNVGIFIVLIITVIVMVNLWVRMIDESDYYSLYELLEKNPEIEKQVINETQQEQSLSLDFPIREDDELEKVIPEDTEDDIATTMEEELPLEKIMNTVANYNKRLKLGMIAGFLVFIVSLTGGILNNTKTFIEILVLTNKNKAGGK